MLKVEEGGHLSMGWIEPRRSGSGKVQHVTLPKDKRSWVPVRNGRNKHHRINVVEALCIQRCSVCCTTEHLGCFDLLLTAAQHLLPVHSHCWVVTPLSCLMDGMIYAWFAGVLLRIHDPYRPPYWPSSGKRDVHELDPEMETLAIKSAPINKDALEYEPSLGIHLGSLPINDHAPLHTPSQTFEPELNLPGWCRCFHGSM